MLHTVYKDRDLRHGHHPRTGHTPAPDLKASCLLEHHFLNIPAAGGSGGTGAAADGRMRVCGLFPGSGGELRGQRCFLSCAGFHTVHPLDDEKGGRCPVPAAQRWGVALNLR